MNRKTLCALLLAAGVSVGGTSVAHHSFAAFDMQHTVAITGTVKDFAWVNPHAWIYVNVTKADGSTEQWALECSSPNMMIRWGWNKSDIKAGDKITVDMHPSRDGKPVASVYAVFLANGKVLADPMGRRVSGDDLARGPPNLPEKPTGTPYR
jgi:hypothetical protein